MANNVDSKLGREGLIESQDFPSKHLKFSVAILLSFCWQKDDRHNLQLDTDICLNSNINDCISARNNLFQVINKNNR